MSLQKQDINSKRKGYVETIAAKHREVEELCNQIDDLYCGIRRLNPPNLSNIGW